MSALFNTIFGVLCTALLGTYITNKIAEFFQRRTVLNNIKIKKAEEQIKQISDLSIRINKSSASRRFAMQNLINALLNNGQNIDEIRNEYRIEVKNWNIDLTSYNIELSMMSLTELAIHYLEGVDYGESAYASGVHRNFFKAHNLLNRYINGDKNTLLLIKAQDLLNISYKETKYISEQLVIESNNIWNNLKNNETDPLSIYNLGRAETFQLILAIFHHPRSNFLRVKRPSRD